MKKLLFTLLFFAFQTQANILIEPYLSYTAFGGGESTVASAAAKDEYSPSGYDVGGRFGTQFLGLMGGLDIAKGSIKVESERSIGSTFTDEYDRTRVGVFVGYNAPLLVRAWGAYHFLNKAEDTNSSGRFSSGTKLDGTSLELGVGVTLLPLVSLNVGFRNNTYDEYETNGTTTKLSGDNEVSVQEIFVGVSLPLTL